MADLPTLQLTANGTVSSCRFVKVDYSTSAHKAVHCASGADSPIGISVGGASANQTFTAFAPGSVGYLTANSSGWSYGQLLTATSDGSGKGTPATPGTVAGAYALTPALPGEIRPVLVITPDLSPKVSNLTLSPTTGASAYVWVNNTMQTTTYTLSNGVCAVTPYLVNKPITVAKIGAEVTTVGGTGANVRYGIYNDGGNSYPGSLLFDAGTTPSGPTGATGMTAAGNAIVSLGASAQLLNPGLYWFAVASQNAAGAQFTAPNGPGWPATNLSMPTAPSTGEEDVGYYTSGVTAGLPNPFPTTVNTISGIPRIFIQVA